MPLIQLYSARTGYSTLLHLSQVDSFCDKIWQFSSHFVWVKKKKKTSMSNASLQAGMCQDTFYWGEGRFHLQVSRRSLPKSKPV